VKDERYNGYANFETWSLANWLMNDEYLNNTLIPLFSKNKNAYEAGEILREWFLGDAAEYWGDKYQDVRNDCGSEWNIEYSELVGTDEDRGFEDEN